DRGIQWNEEAVIRDLSGPPNRWDIPTIRSNVLDKYQRDQIKGTQFDAKSIMLYSFPAEWTVDGFHTESNTKLSDIDQAFAASELMYPRRDSGSPQVVQLNVAEVIPTEASIGKAGEEDLFKFMANLAGHYTIETDGNTDLMMKLYGPNSQTKLIAEDDDTGPGSNPRIDADLAPGEYFIQVRHYNKANGTGAYRIKVFK
ncbi:MAG: pre-peptidase C-terminal domain-containing protein, partial [Microcystaceae cyanobacterium]